MSGTIGNILGQESFDWVTSTTPIPYRHGYISGANPSINTGIYSVGKCLYVASFGTLQLFNGLTAHSSGFLCGHLRIETNSTSYNEIQFKNGANLLFKFRFDSATNMVFIYNHLNVLQVTSTNTFAKGVWYWFNIKYVVADSGGEVTLRLGDKADSDFVTWTGDTLTGTYSTVTSITMQIEGYVSIDNLIVYEPGTYISERRITVQRATGDSAYKSDFIPSTGSDNYAMIDETNANISDYNESTTVGNIDLFTREAVTLASVDAVSYCSLAAKTDAGARSLSHIARVSSTDYESSAYTLTASPLVYETRYPVNPNTNATWAISEINSTEFGYKDQA